MRAPFEIDADTLGRLIETDGLALVPLSAAQRMRASLELRKSGMRAYSDDDASLGLRRRLDVVKVILTDDARGRLDAMPVLLAPSALPDARLVELKGRPAVILCRGLFDLVHFRTTLTAICSKLHRSAINIATIDDLSPADAMMLAGQVALFDAYASLRPLASVADVLSGQELRDLDLGVSTSLLLLVLHEIGHHALGHRNGEGVAKNGVVEAQEPAAPQKSRSEMEFEADSFSVHAVRSDWRSQILASLISLHDTFQFLETFGVRPSREYPTTGARLAALVERSELGSEEALFARSWLADYERRRIEIGAGPMTQEALAQRFEKVMDVRTAYQVIQFLSAELRAQDN